MKASEMTNEELAKELIETVGLDGPFCICERCSTVREAAARLRHATVREMAHRAAVEAYRLEVKDLNSKQHATICDLRRRLKVAEDAMTELRECLQEACDVACDGCRLAVWNNGKVVKCKKHKNWKCPFGTERWRKALEGGNNEVE